MIDANWYLWVIGFSALWGAIAGRVFAVEGQTPIGAILAAGYIGAGSGLLSGPPMALLLIFLRMSPTTTTSALIDTLDDFGGGLLWGPIGGALGGLVVGLIVVILGGGRRASLR